MADGRRVLLTLYLPGGQGGMLTLSRSDGVSLEPWLDVPLAHPLALAPVGHVGVHGTLRLALVDEEGTLLWLEVPRGKTSASPRVLARKLDRRLSPSLSASRGPPLVAFTKTVDGFMHTFVARVSAASASVDDVTPVSHGAAAGTFVLGAKEPVLVMLDARAGVSPLLEVGFEADGKPRAALVRTPVSQPYTPPLLVAFALHSTDVQVAYTAIGRAAATAVGIVPLRKVELPRALLPSLGYGALGITAALGSRAVVFALESPLAAAADAPRAIVVKVHDDQGEGSDLTIQCERGCARPSLVAGGDARVFFLLHAEGKGLVLTTLDCDA